MDIRRLLDWATAQLAEVASPRSDAEWLLAHVLAVERARLPLVDRITSADAQTFQDLIAQRARRIPLQHLTGTAPFRYRNLAVGPGVFIPRPETELLAGWAIDAAEALPQPIIADLCAGSGAIAGAIASEVPAARVYAVELEESALVYAEQNLADLDVDLRHGDFRTALQDLTAQVDIVVSNPPYIPLEAWESVETEVRDHDPALALWSGQDGLDAIRDLEEVAYRLLKPGGVVGIEHAAEQGNSAPAVFAARWSRVVDHRDWADRPRYMTAHKSLAPASIPDAGHKMMR